MRRLELHGRTWWLATRSYLSPLAAKGAFERALAGGLQEDVGVLRHGTSSSIPAEAVPIYVSVVGEDRAAVEAVVLRLPPGLDFDLGDELAASIVTRRARLLAEQDGGGRMVSRRPEGRGAVLRPDGRLQESPPGRG